MQVLPSYRNQSIDIPSKYGSRDMPNFDFLEKGLKIVSVPHFVYEFSRKIFFMSCSINWPNVIVWLRLNLELLGNMCIVNVCFLIVTLSF